MMELGKEGAFSINVYSPGNLIAREITINGDVSLGGDLQHRGFSDEQVARALMACVGSDKVINSKRRWAGAYWYLRWVCNYPVEIPKFCEKIHSLPATFPANCDCSYESIRKLCNLSFIEYDPSKMDDVKVGEELGKAYLPKL